MALEFFQNSSRILLPSAPMIEVDELQMLFKAFVSFPCILSFVFSTSLLRIFSKNSDMNLNRNVVRIATDIAKEIGI